VDSGGRIRVVPKKGTIFMIDLNNRRIIARGEFLQQKFTKLRKIARK